MRNTSLLLLALAQLPFCAVDAKGRKMKPLDWDEEQEERPRWRQEQKEYSSNRRHRYSGGSSSENTQDTEHDFSDFFNNIQNISSFIFPTIRPRGILEGSFNALKSSLIGLVISATSLIGIPVYSAIRTGLGGFIAGGIIGSLLAGSVAIVTIINALNQIFQGALGTPSSIKATLAGKTWDPDRGEWIFYSLQEETKQMEIQRISNRGDGHIAYYNILGVEPNASQNEIKKAYRKKARHVHPDKNPDDETAKEEFLRLHNAYSTLSDERLRADYDRYGATSVTRGFDPMVFFAVLLDADSVEHLIGELQVSVLVSKAQELVDRARTSDIDPEWLSNFLAGWKSDSRRRHIDIANNLLSFLKDYERGNVSEEQFGFICQKEAEKIADSTFGTKFLELIGKALKSEANKYLGYSMPHTIPGGIFASALQTVDSILSTIKAGRQAFVLASEGISSGNFTGFISDERPNELDPETIKAFLPNLLALAWAYIGSDVSGALQGACRRLFTDFVPRKIRRRRARGLRILAQSMLKAKSEICTDESLSSGEIKRRLEQALELAVLKTNK